MEDAKKKARRYCNCLKYKPNMDALDAIFFSAFVHNVHYKGESFDYCPWCSRKLLYDHVFSVFTNEKEWYFWDIAWEKKSGPFKTEEEARKKEKECLNAIFG